MTPGAKRVLALCLALSACAPLAGCSTYRGDLQTICATRSAELAALQLRTERGRKLVDTLIRSTSKERFSTLGAELQRERVEGCPLLKEWTAQ